MSRNNSAALKVLAALIICVLFAWVLYVNIEFYDETQTSSWSNEALRNPFLAAQTFMRRSGMGVTDVENLIKLDRLPGLGTIFFSNANQIQSSRQLQRVMQWLKQGGHVIYTANDVAHADDLLLREFGVEVERYDDEAQAGDAETQERSFSETMREYNRLIKEGKSREEVAETLNEQKTSVTRIKFDDDIGDIEVGFDNQKILDHPYLGDSDYGDGHRPFSWSNSDYGVHMMQFDVGDGLLTFISDASIWTSYRIDSHDNAYLLWLLSSGDGDLAILRSVLRDSVWILIARNGTEILIAAGCWILIWMWHLGYRFGPMRSRDLSRTRALAEHFSSIAHYMWHRRDADYLITPLRQRVQRRASRVLSEFSQADETRQYEMLGLRCDLNPLAVSRAFREREFNETSFVKTVRLLKRIEQSL